MKEKLIAHVGHNLTVASYLDLNGEIENLSVECLDCNEVLYDVTVADVEATPYVEDPKLTILLDMIFSRETTVQDCLDYARENGIPLNDPNDHSLL